MKITKLVFLSVVTLCVANVPFVFAQIETPTNAPRPIQGVRVEFQNGIQNIREGMQEGVKEMREGARETTKEVREQVRENVQNIRVETRQKTEEIRGTVREEVRNIKEAIPNPSAVSKEEFMQAREKAIETAKKIQEESKEKIQLLREDQTTVVMEKREELKKQIETQREEFKKQVEEKREELKKQIETKKVEFEARVAQLKDEKKKEVMTRIGQNLNEANKRALENFSNIVERLEKVLLNINSRADKASAAGKDVSGIKSAVGEANTAIVAARVAIQEQMGKVYAITINTEETLKNDASAARDTLKNDLEKVKVAVQKIKETLQKAALSLAQIPEINLIETNNQISSSTASSTVPVEQNTQQ
ncbi:MAG: hypothetical protein AB1333_00190 [Patescibacteria group bacterium]